MAYSRSEIMDGYTFWCTDIWSEAWVRWIVEISVAESWGTVATADVACDICRDHCIRGEGGKDPCVEFLPRPWVRPYAYPVENSGKESYLATTTYSKESAAALPGHSTVDSSIADNGGYFAPFSGSRWPNGHSVYPDPLFAPSPLTLLSAPT